MDREYMQEVINGMRKIVKPYLAKQLKKINFEGCGNTDKAEFETDFEIVLTLAEQALAIPSAEPKTGYWILTDEQNKEDVENDNYRFICSECQCSDIHAKGTIVPYCWKCGCRMVEAQRKE